MISIVNLIDNDNQYQIAAVRMNYGLRHKFRN